jgi:hypothetical protein
MFDGAVKSDGPSLGAWNFRFAEGYDAILFRESSVGRGAKSGLCLNCRTSADVQAEGAQIDCVSHGWHAPNPQMRKVHLMLQA